MELSALTINLWGTNGPVAQRMDDLAGYLAAGRPDVVALQEVEAWQGVSAAVWLADRAGYVHVHEIRTDRGGRRGEGLAVLTDLDGDPAGTVPLPEAPDDHPRGAQLVDVATPAGGVVRIANTHLTWQIDAVDERAAQARALREALAGWSGDIVLMGDLNDVPGSAAITVLTEPADSYDPLADACTNSDLATAITFDIANPYMDYPELAGRHVDHVLVRGFQVGAARVVLDGGDSPVVSDHYGVRVRLVAG